MRKVVRLLATTVALASMAGCHPLDNAMVAVFGRSMRDQRSFDPYENTRPEPEHSISFASGDFPINEHSVNIGEPEGVDVIPFTQADMLPIGTGNEKVQSLVNTVDPNDSTELARGKVMFERYCAVCHGYQGIGAQAPIAAKHPTVAAYNLAGPAVQGYTDQYIYGMMRVGRGLMPAYGYRITHFDRWRIVNYIRKLEADFNAQQGGGGN
ncbi:MAG: cytochrome c [Gemmatimonadota bacterium]|jgi:mono/diheme cytochrome c family protein